MGTRLARHRRVATTQRDGSNSISPAERASAGNRRRALRTHAANRRAERVQRDGHKKRPNTRSLDDHEPGSIGRAGPGKAHLPAPRIGPARAARTGEDLGSHREERNRKVNVMMTGRTVLALTLLLALLMSTSGCLRLVGIKDRNITPITERDVPIKKTRNGRREIQTVITLRGATQKFGYNSTLWRFTRMPCIRAQPGFYTMLDTGLDAPGRITLDLVTAQKYPAYLGEPADFTFVSSLKIGGLTFSNMLVFIETNRYEAQFLGL